jgi:hypothetical protein
VDEIHAVAPLVVCADGLRSVGRQLLQQLAEPGREAEARIVASRRQELADYGRDFIRAVVPSEAGLPSLGGVDGSWMGAAGGGWGAFAATMPVSC